MVLTLCKPDISVPVERQRGRAVKAVDSKSTGISRAGSSPAVVDSFGLLEGKKGKEKRERNKI